MLIICLKLKKCLFLTESEMPWYEDDDQREEMDHVTRNLLTTRSNDACCQQETLNPFVCAVDIRMSDETEADWVKEQISPFLQWIDPAFQIIRIADENTDHFTIIAKSLAQSERNQIQDSCDAVDQRTLRTQSLSIVLFLREDAAGQLTAQAAKRYLKSTPWEFHHKIELANPRDLKPVACQEYYQLSPNLPLFSVCSVHYGCEQLRFNLFTRNFEDMKRFYSAVTGKEKEISRAGFCSFHLYSQPGLAFQLSLKFSPYLKPHLTDTAMLRFRVNDVQRLRENLVFPLMPTGESNTWLTRDPDDNIITIECECPYAKKLQTDNSDSGEWSRSETSSSEIDTSWNSTWETASV